ncbi:MAG: YhcH/YjgK/YiaL family protein [Synergistaceae bacterium]|nr:YhcH/YjgK/YiaL family protein [Synergistaceae bacterium]
MFHTNVTIAEKYDYLAPKFRAAYKWLAETDLAAIADGKYRVMGDDVIADVQTYTTQYASERRFETHDAHFDIQYIAEGQEFFGVCPREGLTLIESHPERDAEFWKNPDGDYSMVLLHEGEFIVVAPEEAHKPRCAVGSPERVRKVVLKVKV